MPETRGGFSTIPRTPEPQETNTPSLSRSEQKIMWKKDAEHILENLWETEEEDALHEISMKLATRGILKFLRYSGEELLDLSHVDIDGSELKLQKHEVGDTRMLYHHWTHLKEKGMLPEDKESIRFTSISRRDWADFAYDAVSMRLLIEESNVLVNSASASKVNPGNICKLMSTTNKPKSTSTAVNTPAPSKNVFKSEIIVDGKMHREVSKYIACSISKTSRSGHHSLVDRGANGGGKCIK